MKVAHIRLCHSRMLFVRAQEMVFDAHNRERSPFSGERGTIKLNRLAALTEWHRLAA